MARRKIEMNEIVEMIYQWHQGAGFKAIRRSLGFDRKTIRKYVGLACLVGVARGSPFPEESELIGKLKEGQKLAIVNAFTEASGLAGKPAAPANGAPETKTQN